VKKITSFREMADLETTWGSDTAAAHLQAMYVTMLNKSGEVEKKTFICFF